MAENVQSDIIINVDTSVGIAEIKNLQRQISALNSQLMQSGATQAKAAQNIQRNLLNNINATGDFAARVKTIASTTETFTTRLEKNKMGMGEYFRYAGGASKTFGRLFKNEFDTIEKVARERVKTLQTQYIKLGRDANGALKAISVRPLALDMENLATKTAMAAQKQQLMNQLLKQGSTNLLNFGKNTQWAGRQLMVGFSIPLAYLGTAAAKTFMQMEEQALKFKRVYGETFTSSAETDKMVSQVKSLANEFTKYGVAAEKTMKMAADAAAMGKQGSELLAQVNEATKLSVLGNVEQEQALETTISLTNAFGIAADKLSGKIDFLNAVENQTVTSIEDLTIAVPKAGPVIQQLGGDVEDLAFFLTAMKEGGINASEGANALKSGLASLINPTAKASEMLSGFGINIKGIVEANKGDVKGTVVEFAKALDTLDPLNRARAIEQLFGKFQFARLSTLFQNVIAEGSQAERVLKLSSATAAELAILSEREMKRIEDSPMYKFQKAVEDIKVSLMPLGEAFLKAVTPIVEFVKGFLDKFNQMGDGAKQFAVIATTVVAGIGPVLLMTFGLIANGAANLIKLFSGIRNMFQGTGKSSQTLGSQTEYMTQQQLEAAAVAASLDQSHSRLIQTFTAEAGAVNKLATAYGRAVVAQSRLTGNPIAATKGTKAPKKYNSGVVSVPGPKGAGDIVPAMLAPGEAVIPAKIASKYSGLIGGMVDGTIPEFSEGRYDTNTEGGIFQNMKKKLRSKPGSWTNVGKDLGYGSFSQEDSIVREILRREAPNLSQKQLQNFAGQYDLAHIKKSTRKEIFDGKQFDVKNWHAENLQKDHRIVNQSIQYFSDAGSPKGTSAWLKSLNPKDIAAISGLSVSQATKELNRLIAGDHPRTKDSYKALMAVSNQHGSYYGKALAGLLEFRINDKSSGSYLRALAEKKLTIDPSLAEKLNAKASESQKRLIAKAQENLTKIKGKPKAKPAVTKAKTAKPIAKQTKANEYSLKNVIANGSRLGKVGRYADGIVSVPGPKGAGDVVPAMLSPGESVIPTEMSKKYAPLISAMVNGKIPGYSSGLDPFGDSNQFGGDPSIGAAKDPFGESNYSFDVKESKSFGSGIASGFVDKVLPIGKRLAANFGDELKQDGKKIGKKIMSGAKDSATNFLARQASKLTGGAVDVQGVNGKTYNNGVEARTDKNGNQYYVQKGKGRISAQAAAENEVAPTGNGRRSGRFGGAAQAGMGLSMAVGMASAVPGAVGEAAQKALGPISAATAAMSLIPGPWGVAAGAITGVGVAMYQANEEFVAFRKEAQKTASTMSSGMEAMKSLSEFAGTVSPSETLAKIRADEASQYNVQTGKETFGGSYLESEQGKLLVDSARKTSILSGKDVAVSDMATQMAQAIQTNVLTKEQAASIVMNLGAELKDHDFSANVLAKITKLVGPGGEDITNKPLEVAARIIQEKQSSFGKEGETGTVKGLLSAETSNGWGGRANYTEVAAAEAKYAQGYQDILDMGQQNLDNLELQHRAQIDTLTAAGDLKGIEKENLEYQQKKTDLQVANAAAVKTEYDYISGLENSSNYVVNKSAEQIVDNLENTKEALFDSMDQASKDAAQLAVRNISDNVDLSFADKATLVAGITVDNIDDYQKLQAMFPVSEEPQIWEKIAKVSVKYGPAAQEQLTKLGGFFEDSDAGKQSYEVFIDYVTNSADGQEVMDTLTQITRVSKEVNNGRPIVMSELIDTKTGKPTQKMREIQAGIKNVSDAIKKNKGKSIKYSFETTGFKLTKSQADYFNSLPADQQKIYTTTFLTVKKTVDDAAVAEWRAAQTAQGSTTGNWAASLTNDQVKDQIAGKAAWTDTQVLTTEDAKKPGDGDENGGGGAGANPLDEILKKLQNVRKAAIDASGGMKELMKWMKQGGNFTGFSGIEQQLAGKGYNSDFIDWIASADKATQKLYMTIGKNGVVALTAAGKAAQNAFNAIAIGEYQRSVRDSISEINKQVSARNILLAKGNMSYADAVDASKDAGLSEAIAAIMASTNIKDKNKAIAQAIGLWKELKKATEQAKTAEEKFSDAYGAAMDKFSAQEAEIDVAFKIKVDPFEDAVAAAQAEIDKITNQAGGLDDLQAGLTEIGWAEDAINEKYDARQKLLDGQEESLDKQERAIDKQEEALGKVEKANERISAQQKGQLSLADALSSGDVSAAAKAMQEIRAQDAQYALDDQKSAFTGAKSAISDKRYAIGESRKTLDKDKEAELAGLTATVNGKKLTRKEIETQILDLEKKIFKIEEEKLEPARESIRLATVERDLKLDAIDDEKIKWDELKVKIDLAKASASEYLKTLQEAAKLQLEAISNIQNPSGNEVSSDNDSDSEVSATKNKAITDTIKDDGKPDDKNPKDQKTVVAGLLSSIKSAKTAVSASTTLAKKAGVVIGKTSADAAEKKITSYVNKTMGNNTVGVPKGTTLRALMKSSGGMIPQYLAKGGSPFKPLGTDTIPAMLTPGEFVVKKYAVDDFGVDNLKAINNGTYSGNSVYNYELNVSMSGSNLSPDDVARTVMAQIKQIDSQRLRGNTF